MKKTSSPGAYKVSGQDVLVPPATIERQNAQAKGKAKARYPHKPLEPFTDNKESGKMKYRALTPGTSPTGS